MDISELFSAEAVVRSALERLVQIRDNTDKLIRELEEDLITQRMLHAEAIRSVEALERLLEGDIYADNGPILAQETAAAAPKAVPEPEPVAPSAPASLVNLRLVRAAWSDDDWRGAWTPAPEPAPEVMAQPAQAQVEPDEPKRGRPFHLTDGGAPLLQDQQAALVAALVKAGASPAKAVEVSFSELARATGIPPGSISATINRAVEAGRVKVIKSEAQRQPNRYYVAPNGEPFVEPAPAAPPAKELSALDRLEQTLRGLVSPSGHITGTAEAICAAANLPFASWDTAKGLLIKRGVIRVVKMPTRGGGPWVFALGNGEAKDETPPAPQRPNITAAPVNLADLQPRPSRSGPCELVDLGPDECKWPIGQGDPQLYCGKPAPGGNYCQRHADMAYQRPNRANVRLDSRAEDIRKDAVRARWTQ